LLAMAPRQIRRDTPEPRVRWGRVVLMGQQEEHLSGTKERKELAVMTGLQVTPLVRALISRIVELGPPR
jgi:hypothetical protein